jgi:hypothetical protein
MYVCVCTHIHIFIQNHYTKLSSVRVRSVKTTTLN